MYCSFFSAPCLLTEVKRTNFSNTGESFISTYLEHFFPELQKIYLSQIIKLVSELYGQMLYYARKIRELRRKSKPNISHMGEQGVDNIKIVFESSCREHFTFHVSTFWRLLGCGQDGKEISGSRMSSNIFDYINDHFLKEGSSQLCAATQTRTQFQTTEKCFRASKCRYTRIIIN
jgi:hypothetical protein